MRRHILGLVAIALLAACNDSMPTGMRPPAAKNVRAVEVTGTLDENIQDLIALWPNGLATAMLSQWNTIKKQYAQGQTDPAALAAAKSKLFELSSYVTKKTSDINEQLLEPGDTEAAAASRLILYMSLYVYGEDGPNTEPPAYIPGADNAVGILTPDAPLTVVTPSTHAGARFPIGAVGENRVIIITQNPFEPAGECDGPLTTQLCQYPLFYNIESFPTGRLLTAATAAVCPIERAGHPPLDAIHDRLRLAHTKPSNPDNYMPGGTIRYEEGEGDDLVENIEILPLVTQDFVFCVDVSAEEPVASGGGLLNRGLRLAGALASRVGGLLTPRSAYAIDQGGGGGFLDFSPFNNVDPYSDQAVTIDFETPNLGESESLVIDPYVASGVTFTAIPHGGFTDPLVGLVKNQATSACVPVVGEEENQKLGTGRYAVSGSTGFSGFAIKATFGTAVGPLVSITVDVQSGAEGQKAGLLLYNAAGVQIGYAESLIPAQGLCAGSTGNDRGTVTLTASSSTDPVAYAVIDMVPSTGNHVFVIDNFKIQ